MAVYRVTYTSQYGFGEVKINAESEEEAKRIWRSNYALIDADSWSLVAKEIKTYQCIYASEYSFGSWEVEAESEEEAERLYCQRFAGLDCDLYMIIEGDREKGLVATSVVMSGKSQFTCESSSNNEESCNGAENSREKCLKHPKKTVRNPFRAIMATARRYMNERWKL